jgi:flavin reductase (DIM6/NTAB) family NADH-FMN oxidoreductase RutF
MTLIEARLRSIFRELPTMVCVLTGTDEKALYSATISSLVCIDIDADKPIVSFVLKKTSTIGTILESKGRFSISVLDVQQTEVSSKFSQPREKLTLKDFSSEYAKEGTNFYAIPDCFALVEASLVTIIREFESDIYIATVEDSKIDASKTPLMYLNRKYGVFKEL